MIRRNSSRSVTLPGIHIQFPWSDLLLTGKKIVETRKYPLPPKYAGVPLAIIETPGKTKPTFKARVIGIITFSHSIEYVSFEQWKADAKRHRVTPDDPLFRFKQGERKFGWVVKCVTPFEHPCPPPAHRGIIFASACQIPANIAQALNITR